MDLNLKSTNINLDYLQKAKKIITERRVEISQELKSAKKSKTVLKALAGQYSPKLTNKQQEQMAAYIDNLIQTTPEIGDMKLDQVEHEIQLKKIKISKLNKENSELSQKDIFYRELGIKSERMARMKLGVNDIRIESLNPKQRKLFEYLQNEMITQILNPDVKKDTSHFFREQNIIKEFNKNKLILMKAKETEAIPKITIDNTIAIVEDKENNIAMPVTSLENSIADLRGDPTKSDKYNINLFLKEAPVIDKSLRVLQDLYKLSDFETSVLGQWMDEPEQKQPRLVKLYSPVISSQALNSVFNKVLAMDNGTKNNFYGPKIKAEDGNIYRNSLASGVKEYRKEIYDGLREQALKVNNIDIKLLSNFKSPIDVTKIKAPDTVKSKMATRQAAAAVLFLSVAGLDTTEIKDVMEAPKNSHVNGILKEIATNYDYKSAHKYKSTNAAIGDLRAKFNKAYKQDLNLMFSDFIDKGYLGLVDTIKLSNLAALNNKELGNSLRELFEQKSK